MDADFVDGENGLDFELFFEGFPLSNFDRTSFLRWHSLMLLLIDDLLS